MDWPNPQEYNEVVQSPSICFADSDLRTCLVEVNSIGLPRPATGAFASVYKLTKGDRSWAVRCFHKEIPEHKVRYAKILDTLNKLNARWAPGTEFIDRGIKTRGQWFPIVKMDWVEGLTLDRFLSKHGTNKQKVLQVAQTMRNILDDMRSYGIAHGDLQHGNIVVAGDDIKLIDFDGMFVNELTGRKSAELGHPNYQHPFRSPEHFGSYMDNFSAWVIQISLMGIACDPELLSWSNDRECLLFSRADFLSPYESPVFKALTTHSKTELGEAAQTLIQLMKCPVEFVPFLDATSDDLLNLPELDLSEQIRLVDEITSSDASRFVERPPVLSALEQLSSRKRGAHETLGKLLRHATTASEALVSSVLSHMMSVSDLITRGDALYNQGSYKEAVNCYQRALEQLPQSDKKQTSEIELEHIINLQLGRSHILSGNAAASVFYFKSLTTKSDTNPTAAAINGATGLMIAYCQLNRLAEARALLKPPNSAEDLCIMLVAQTDGPMRTVSGLRTALKLGAEWFEGKKQYGRASGMYDTARSMSPAKRCSYTASDAGTDRDSGAVGDAVSVPVSGPVAEAVSGPVASAAAAEGDDLDLLLKLGHCHLLNHRPDLSTQAFHSIMRVHSAPEEVRLRAAIGLAIAFKMSNSRQEVINVLRSCPPAKIYETCRREMDGPLGKLDELGEVVCAFVDQLGEERMTEGVHLATRLAADSFKRADDMRTAEAASALLEQGRFFEANALVNDEILALDHRLREDFARHALAYARQLTSVGLYDSAFGVLDKYGCPADIVVSELEGQVLQHIRAASRQDWNGAEFTSALKILDELIARHILSGELLEFVAQGMLACADRSEAFMSDIRLTADLIAGHVKEGSSHTLVLRLRQFALQAEASVATPKSSSTAKKTSSKQESKLGQLFERSAQSATVSARSRTMELVVLNDLKKAVQMHWDADEFKKVCVGVETMRTQRCLTREFCDKLATSLLTHFSEAAGINRWHAQEMAVPAPRKAEIKAHINALMDTVSTLSTIDKATLRKLQQCVDKL